jgi:hypothetical protein
VDAHLRMSKDIDDLKTALQQPEARQELDRAVIEDVIRELEFEDPVRWGRVIERLRGVL